MKSFKRLIIAGLMKWMHKMGLFDGEQNITYSDDSVTLRTLTDEDCDEVSDWMRDGDTVKYAFGILRDVSQEYMESLVDDYIITMHCCLNNYFAVECSGQLVGIVYYNITSDGDKRRATMGIVIGRREWRHKGTGIRAVRLILHHLFDIKNCDTVELDTADYNLPAQHLYEKSGFQHCNESLYELSFSNRYNTEIMAAPRIFYRFHRADWSFTRTSSQKVP